MHRLSERDDTAARVPGANKGNHSLKNTPPVSDVQITSCLVSIKAILEET